MVAPAYEVAACTICGSSRHSVVSDPDGIRAEMEELWAFHASRLRPSIPPTRLADRVAFSQRPPLAVVRCEGCGLLFRNPRERANALEDAYAEEPVERETLDSLFETQRASYGAQARRLTRANRGRTGRLLEVGSYVGGFLAAAEARGWFVEGLDVNPAAIATARERGLRVRQGTIERFKPATPYDVVAIWNCFEQLPDPRVAALRARAMLAPGGLFVVRVPNGEFYAHWRARLKGRGGTVARALLAHNNLLTFPYRHGFTLPSLVRLVERIGFTVTQVVGDALVPTSDEWTHGWAALEERALKAVLRLHALHSPADAPWLELYARATAEPVAQSTSG